MSTQLCAIVVRTRRMNIAANWVCSDSPFFDVVSSAIILVLNRESFAITAHIIFTVSAFVDETGLPE